MRYKNTKTGAIIDVKSVIAGGNWEKIKEPKAKKKLENSEAKKEAEEDEELCDD